MIGRRGNIILKYQDDEIHLYKYVYDTVPYHIFSQKYIQQTMMLFIYVFSIKIIIATFLQGWWTNDYRT